MKRSTKIITAASVIILGVGAIAGTGIARGYGHGGGHHGMGGHGGGHHAMQMMERFDTDSDGKITAEEMAATRTKAMANYDADKDGGLSIDEFQSLWLEHMRSRMVRHFQQMDSDGDAKITQAEMTKLMDRMMSRMDRNEDGAISKDDRRGWRGHHRDRGDDKHRGPQPDKD